VTGEVVEVEAVYEILKDVTGEVVDVEAV